MIDKTNHVVQPTGVGSKQKSLLAIIPAALAKARTIDKSTIFSLVDSKKREVLVAEVEAAKIPGTGQEKINSVVLECDSRRPRHMSGRHYETAEMRSGEGEE